tara:strand:- start:361 stop:483 length:123 start_codon:yes stop_codon:yes gene_type:complete
MTGGCGMCTVTPNASLLPKIMPGQPNFSVEAVVKEKLPWL